MERCPMSFPTRVDPEKIKWSSSRIQRYVLHAYLTSLRAVAVHCWSVKMIWDEAMVTSGRHG